MVNKRLVNTLSLVTFLLLLISLTRQVPFSFLSGLIAPLLILVCAIVLIKGVTSELIKPFLIFLILLIIASMYSILLGNDVIINFRFLVVLLLINLIPILRINEYFYIKIFNFVFIIQSILVILLGVLLPFFFSLDSYLPLRHYAMNHGWGDIYTYNGILYKVQVVGNALIPFGFFVNFYLYKIGKVGLWILFVYGLAIVFCGNLAFYLFTVFFIIAYHGLEAKGKIKLSLKNIFYLLGALSLTLLFSVYVIESIIMKSSGDVSSIGTRFDQARVLISDMSGSYRELLFGKGLGNTLTIKTQSRDYTGEIYFEIQSLYIVNQIGFIGIITFVCFHLKLISYFLKNNKIILIYICYIGYAMTNPYMFDSNHGIALIILMSLSNLSLKGYRKE